MFEASEVGHKISKARYAEELPNLRADLLDTQYALKEHGKFPVIIVVGGVDGAGKGETVNVLNEWMDPRHIHTVALGPPSEAERQRPRMWRYWMALPPRGSLGILFGSWYTDPITDRAWDRIGQADLNAAIHEIKRFEKMLTDEGALLVKFWFHLSKRDQKARLKRIDEDKQRTWRVTKADWKQFERYDAYHAASEHTLRLTSTAAAPWIVVEGKDERFRHLTVGHSLLHAVRAHLGTAGMSTAHAASAQPVNPADRAEPSVGSPSKPANPLNASPPSEPTNVAPLVRALDQRDALTALDLSKKLDADVYKAELEKWQGRLNRLTRHQRFQELSLIIAFEGMDAAGKGSTIRRITGALDARQYQVVPVAAPSDEERAEPYLWRFWRHLPRKGRLSIYDRSWYGRVLVERIEGFCSEADWMRAYNEINDFEEQLVRSNTVLLKFWMQISEAEQLQRFQEREQTRFKRFKITPEDWRNREKWADYQLAAADMVERTSTEIAPWTLVEAEDKRFARIKVLKTVVKRLRRALAELAPK